MKINKKGIAETVLLLYFLGAVVLFFVPNPVSSSIGVGIRPNKTVQTDKVTLINDKDGNPIAYRRITADNEIQQRVGFFEWLRSLPALVIILMGLGVVFPPVSLFLGGIYRALKTDTKKIVVGVDQALKHVKDDDLKKKMLLEMGNVQNDSTKHLVDKIQGKK
jgi:hypothetical protein